MWIAVNWISVLFRRMGENGDRRRKANSDRQRTALHRGQLAKGGHQLMQGTVANKPVPNELKRAKRSPGKQKSKRKVEPGQRRGKNVAKGVESARTRFGHCATLFVCGLPVRRESLPIVGARSSILHRVELARIAVLARG